MKKQIIISSLILLVAFSFFFINYFNPINLEAVKSALFTLVDFTRTKDLRKENATEREAGKHGYCDNGFDFRQDGNRGMAFR